MTVRYQSAPQLLCVFLDTATASDILYDQKSYSEFSLR